MRPRSRPWAKRATTASPSPSCAADVVRISAGLLLYRYAGNDGHLELFLVHPGGPFFARKDLGSWGIPKGELDGDEDQLAAARREFTEETGFAGPADAS